MKFKDFLLKIKDFLIKRITELFSLIVILLSVTVLIALFSYSPNDPNYIVNNNLKIVNILGFRGSVVSDFLFQSIGLMAYLVPFTIFFTGVTFSLKASSGFLSFSSTSDKHIKLIMKSKKAQCQLLQDFKV